MEKPVLVAILLTLPIFSAVAIPFNSLQDPLPIYECKNESIPEACTIVGINTNRTHPQFRITHPAPETINIVIIQGFNMAILTSDICDYFPNLLGLSIYFANVEGFDTRPFANCRNLLSLLIYVSKFDEIPVNLFSDTPNMTIIDFYKAPVKSIKVNQFNGLSQLRVVALMGLEIDDFPLQSVDSPGLETLYLYSNNFKDIPAQGIVDRFPALKYVGYNDNDILCSRVPQINNVFRLKGVEIKLDTATKPRQEETEVVEDIICVP